MAKAPRAATAQSNGPEFAPVSLVALWFGSTPFQSPTVLERLITLFTLAVPDEDEASPAPPTHEQAADGRPAPPSFSSLYNHIVRTAIAANKQSAGSSRNTATNVDQDAVTLCLASTRTISCLVTLEAVPLTRLVGAYRPCVSSIHQNDDSLLSLDWIWLTRLLQTKNLVVFRADLGFHFICRSSL